VKALLDRLTGSGRRRVSQPSRRRSEPDHARPAPRPLDYVVFHPTGERMSIEVARSRVGEWQPESERDALRAFLAGTADPDVTASLESRDFTSIETGAVCLSRGVRWVSPPAVGDRTRQVHVHHQEVATA
jgi:hypothetical protein